MAYRAKLKTHDQWRNQQWRKSWRITG